MTKRSLQHLLKLSVVTTTALVALSARADLQERKDDRRDRDDDRRGGLSLPTGQLITPTFIDGAVQVWDEVADKL